jgi:hypothetical protein
MARTCGTQSGYRGGCRCDDCRRANRDYGREWYRRRRGVTGRATDSDGRNEAFGDLLHELFPFGLTDDCPARRQRVAA